MNPAIKSFGLIAAGFVFLIAVSAASVVFLGKLDLFNVRTVIVRGAGGDDSRAISGLFAGTNIFTIDIFAVSRSLYRSHTECKKIRVMRFPPDSIVVDFLKRKPVARIASSGRLVDENRFVFDAETGVDPDLPVITGLGSRLNSKAVKGRRCEVPELILALNLLKAANANQYLRENPIREVNVAQANNASLFFLVSPGPQQYTNGTVQTHVLEAKIGSHDIVGKISIMATLLAQVKNNLGSIKYIDLRFKEPLIKFKDMEAG